MGDLLGRFTNFILTTVTWNTGYRVTFLIGYFDDVQLVDFATTVSRGNAQARIDNIVVPDPVEPPPVPVPAAGWLLMAGLGGLAAMRRRKAA